MSVVTDEWNWNVEQGDCIELMNGMPDASVDLSVFSPPFPSLYSYTDSEHDIGNSADLRGEAKLHLSYFFKQLARLIKPGRVIVVHCMQIPGLKRNGELSTFDFRGLLIRLGKRAGLLYDGDITVTKNPQAQAIRTHSTKLLFVTLARDRAVSHPAFCDYLIKFRASGTNGCPINSTEISRNDWIKWAEGCWDWHEIRETDTLNTAAAKSESDTKHICPLQLGVIKRLVLMYSNPGELVYSPFAGIGSEGYISLLKGRRFLGHELKQEYFDECCRNLSKAVSKRAQAVRTLF